MPDNKYYRAIYGCAKEHGLTNDDIHDVVSMRFGKLSLKELSNDECRQLLDGLRGNKRRGDGASGWSNTRRGEAMSGAGRKDADRTYGTEYMVAARELELLREAAELRGWSRETLDTFIRRQLRGRQIRTIRDYNKVFWAVKAMNRRDGLTGKYDTPLPRAEVSATEAPI